MEVANKIKDLSLDINIIGLYDEAEEREKMMNSLKAEGEALGEKKGADNVRKSIAKNLLKDGFSVDKISKYTGLSEKQIANLV